MANTMVEGSLVWIEIPTTEHNSELKNFYTSLFPQWKFHDDHASNADASAPRVAGYALPWGLGGGIVNMPEGCKPFDQPMGNGFTNYYKVDNLDDTEARVHTLGGKTCLGKTKQGEGGWFMNFNDPQGNRFGAYEFAK